MQKGFAPIFVLVSALVIALIAGGIYYLGTGKNQPIQQPIQQATPSPTSIPSSSKAPAVEADPVANWKTYTSAKYGFSFKYPDSENWKFMNLPNPLTNEDNTFLVECNNRCRDRENITSFQVSLSSFKSLNEYLSEAKKSTADKQGISEYTYTNFDGKQAIEAVDQGFCPKGKEGRCENSSTEIFIIKNNQGFVLKQYFKDLINLTKLNEFPKPIPDILSTFKFLD